MKTINELFNDSTEPNIIEIEKLIFKDINNKDVYNISKMFKIGEIEYLFGRVEPRDNSELSKVFLFKKKNNEWIISKDFKPLENSEDPFISKIKNKLILGCVEVIKIEKGPDFDPENTLNYRTVLYELTDLRNPRKIFEGPWKMKDIRFIELQDKRIAIFSRPQGNKAGRGKIGFTIINSLEELKYSDLEEASFLPYFNDEEWGGANEVHLLNNGNLFVLGHIAKRNEDYSLSYYPMYFTINPETKEHSEIKILFQRKNLPEGQSKNDKLKDVIFPGGLYPNEDKTIDIYIGAGDAEAYKIRIKNDLDN